MAAYLPQAECPLCHRKFDGREELRGHLVADHDTAAVVDMACRLLEESGRLTA